MPMRERRQFSAEFEARIARELLSGRKRDGGLSRVSVQAGTAQLKADFVTQATTGLRATSGTSAPSSALQIQGG